MKITRKHVDVAVVGSGPGGATVARQLARAGKRVLLLEKGRYHRFIGNHLSALFTVDKMGMNWTAEGLNIVRAFTVGGSTLMYCGAAADPPDWLRDRYGIDLTPYAEQTRRELNLQPLPDEVVGVAGLRILEAANELGYHFHKLDKFIRADRCRSVCGGTCMLGCPYGAKWTAREYVEEMRAAGGELVERANVQRILIEDGVATGLVASTPRGSLTVDADVVILSAGGLGTPAILLRSGIEEAGRGMFVDPLVFVTGVSRFRGTCLGPPMTIGTYELLDEGILLSDLIDPWGMWLLMTARKNPSKLLQFFSYRRQLSLMVKIGDERRGTITADERISKPLSKQDHARLDRGASLAREILVRAGCDPKSIMVGPVRGAHPGATARIGEVVDNNLQTRIQNLYISDASVLPEALDRPVVLTAISLAKRLAEHLLRQTAGA
ncbi:MAG: GMC family oxidoreductase [Bradymonadales bacterium]|nr:GMC family oxidoreductase [Bradymonadales bacterium]